MAPFHAQHILRHYRDDAAQQERPVGGRADQNSYADSRDVSARKIEPLSEKDATENQLGNDGRRDRERRLVIAFQNAVRKMADQQDEGDKEWSDVTRIETEPSVCPFEWRVIADSPETDSCSLLNLVHPAHRGIINGLSLSRWPANHCLFDLRIFA